MEEMSVLEFVINIILCPLLGYLIVFLPIALFKLSKLMIDLIRDDIKKYREEYSSNE